jgi:hypothetical protein
VRYGKVLSKVEGEINRIALDDRGDTEPGQPAGP